MVGWFDELALAPDSHPVSMGTRSLGDRSWLVADADFAADLAEKRRLLAERPGEVAWMTDRSTPAATHLRDLVATEHRPPPPNTHALVATAPSPEPAEGGAPHPLVTAALSVQEDLILLQRREDTDGLPAWHHDASVVCFPTYWTLGEKVGRPVARVHDPVEGYAARIAARVTRLFDRLAAGGPTVWRRNWGLTADPTLFQPRRRGGDPHVSADRVLTDLYVRSERQTLRSLGPVYDDWIVFTVRIQRATIGELVGDDPTRRTRFADWVAHVPPELASGRHLSEPQRAELLAALHNKPASGG